MGQHLIEKFAEVEKSDFGRIDHALVLQGSAEFSRSNEFEAQRREVDAILGRADSGSTDTYSHTFNEQLARWMALYWDRVSTQGTTEERRTKALVLG